MDLRHYRCRAVMTDPGLVKDPQQRGLVRDRVPWPGTAASAIEPRRDPPGGVPLRHGRGDGGRRRACGRAVTRRLPEPGGGPAAIRETHSAIVFLVGDRSYKVKKPVDLGFLDVRTREAREAACHREVALNRRLAPDVYLALAAVERGG